MDKTYKLLQEIRKRPEIYIGKASLERLYAFLNGYKHHELPSPPDCLDGFQNYVEGIYDIHTDHNWASIIQFFSSTEEEAFNEFYKLFDNYMKNRS